MESFLECFLECLESFLDDSVSSFSEDADFRALPALAVELSPSSFDRGTSRASGLTAGNAPGEVHRMLPSGPGRHDMPFVAASSSAGADLECE